MREDYDLVFLVGDQIYENGVESLGTTWFERYVNRYHQFWTHWPLREVMRRTPTYMIFDDHEVHNFWGTQPLPRERVEGALQAYRAFQHSHNPGGLDQNGKFHYHFKKGFASFFFVDNRSQRSVPPGSSPFPVLGPEQVRDLEQWANSSETLASDIIVVSIPVPIAYVPIDEVIRLKEELEKETSELGAIAGFLAGGPLGVGGLLGAAVGAYAGHELAEEKTSKLTTIDKEDRWDFSPNQKNLERLLDVLFDLANDQRGRGRRLVLLLSGDVHLSTMHVIRSRRDQHAASFRFFQVTSSPISNKPERHQGLEFAIRHFQEGKDIDQIDLVQSQFNSERILEEVFGKDSARFCLDPDHDKAFFAEFAGIFTGNNFGRIVLTRRDANKRMYRIAMFVEGRSGGIRQILDVDLDKEPVEIRSVIGSVLQAEGRLTFLRVHDIGTGFGPVSDNLDAEVILQLDTMPESFLGFQLRADKNEANNYKMLDVARDAFNRGRVVSLDYLQTGPKNGMVIRIAEKSQRPVLATIDVSPSLFLVGAPEDSNEPR